MKLTKKTLLTFLVVMLGVSVGIAQDTVEVPVLSPNDGEFLNTYMDDNPADVYKLKRGETYFMNNSVQLNEALDIVGEEGNSEETAPAKIRAGYDDQGRLINTLFAVNGDITFKNVYIIGRGVGSKWDMTAQTIQCQGSGNELFLDNIILEGNQENGFVISGDNWDITVKNSIFRNNMNQTQNYNGRAIRNNGSVAGEIVMKNNTYFNITAYAIVTPVCEKFVFDHNTMVNTMTDVFFAHQMANAEITNNIFYNPEFNPLVDAELVWKNFDAEVAGVICQDTLSDGAKAAYDTLLGGSDWSRKVAVKSNVYYWDQEVKDFWNSADTLYSTPWIDENTQKFFDDDENYPDMVATDNVEKDPGFANKGDNLSAMVQQGKYIRQPSTGDIENIYWGVPSSGEIQWPLPEDLSYSADLTGTDGKAIGDLNWQEGGTAVDNNGSNPDSYTLEQNYPNPFNPTTNIGFKLKNSTDVTLSVYNMLGQKVRTMNLGKMSAQHHTVKFNGSDLSSGVYIYRLQAGNKVVGTKKMVLVK